jgi:hypothetical protein
MGVPNKLDFFSLQWAILIGQLPNRENTLKVPQNENFFWKHWVNPLWSTYIGEDTTTLGKSNVVLLGTYAGTHWELGHLVITWKEQIRNMKKAKNSTPTPALPKRKKPWVFRMHGLLPHCLGKISIPTFVCHHFQTIGGLTHESIN